MRQIILLAMFLSVFAPVDSAIGTTCDPTASIVLSPVIEQRWEQISTRTSERWVTSDQILEATADQDIAVQSVPQEVYVNLPWHIQASILLKAREVAQYFKVAPRTVTKWCIDGRLKCQRRPEPGGDFYAPLVAYAQMLKNHSVPNSIAEFQLTDNWASLLSSSRDGWINSAQAKRVGGLAEITNETLATLPIAAQRALLLSIEDVAGLVGKAPETVSRMFDLDKIKGFRNALDERKIPLTRYVNFLNINNIRHSLLAP